MTPSRTPELDQQPLFIHSPTPSTPPTPMPVITLAPGITMSDFPVGVQRMVDDWIFSGAFDDSNASAFPSPASSPSASSSGSAPPTPPQPHFAPGFQGPIFPFGVSSPIAGCPPPYGTRFQIVYPGSVYPGDSMYPDELTPGQMNDMGPLMGMQGNGEAQLQEDLSMFNNAYFNNGVYMG